MSNNKLVIASAGSGKTTYLVEEALKQKKSSVLITTYTQTNEQEIRKKIIEINNYIPKNIKVQTWFSLLLQHGVKPYQGYLYENKISGLILVNSLSAVKYYNKYGVPVSYKEDDVQNHYFNNNNKIFSDKLSKFVFKCNSLSKGSVIDRLSRIYNNIFIDEVQDLAGYDLEIIKLLFKSRSRILLVGDPRQVTYLTHLERKHKPYREGKIKEFITDKCKDIECIIDETSLNVSHRCNEIISSYSSKLYPNFKQSKSSQCEENPHKGIFLVKKEDVIDYLMKYQPMQLRDNKNSKVNAEFNAMNIGDSKGLSFDRVLIYPTQPFINWLEGSTPLKPTSRSKFYVALTRARHSVGIVYDYSDQTNIKDLYKFNYYKDM